MGVSRLLMSNTVVNPGSGSNGINIRDVQKYELKSTPQFSEVVSHEFSSYLKSKKRKDVHLAALSRTWLSRPLL